MYGKDRNLLIDCIRGFSILIVIAQHGALDALPAQYLIPIRYIVKGYYGVVIFFTISGFLITRNALRRYDRLSRIDFGQFYAMRVARIIPCLLLFLTTMVGLYWLDVDGFVPATPHLILSGIYNALIFQYNSFYLVSGNVPGMYAWGPLWSLSIEEVFYFAFPIACFLTRRTSVLVVLMLAMILYGPFVRMDHVGLYSFWGNADLLSLGCLAAFLERRFPIGNQSVLLCASGAALAVITIVETSPDPDYYWAPTLIGLGAALFLFGAVQIPSIRTWRIVSPVTWLFSRFGQASYEIYLFHFAMIVFYGRIAAALHLSGTLFTAVFLGITLAVGLTISRQFTEPLNRIVRGFYANEARRAQLDVAVPQMAE
jgi:peptidoglycan/LPS O-acetylase OafA/YrhL